MSTPHAGRAVLILVALSAPGLTRLSARAQSALTFHYGAASKDTAASEEGLRDWLGREPAVRRKLAALASRAEASGKKKGMEDLRDSPGPRPDAEALRRRLAKADIEERGALLQELPGMRPHPFHGCRSLQSCPEAPTSYHVNDADEIDSAVIALIRPWILLQKARELELRVTQAPQGDEKIVRLSLEGRPDVLLEVRASGTWSGGFNVWTHGLPDPSGLYASERADALARAR